MLWVYIYIYTVYQRHSFSEITFQLLCISTARHLSDSSLIIMTSFKNALRQRILMLKHAPTKNVCAETSYSVSLQNRKQWYIQLHYIYNEKVIGPTDTNQIFQLTWLFLTVIIERTCWSNTTEGGEANCEDKRGTEVQVWNGSWL